MLLPACCSETWTPPRSSPSPSPSKRTTGSAATPTSTPASTPPSYILSPSFLFFSLLYFCFLFFLVVFFLILFKYSEKLLVGYRWYDNQNIVPLWPFGHGLSYTTFLYSNLQIDGDVSPSLPPSFITSSLSPSSLSSFYSFLFIVLIRSPQLCMSRWAYRTQEPFSALRLFRCTFSSPLRPASHQRYADKERGERGRERGKEDINIECIGVAWVRQIRHRTLFHSRGLLQLGPRINLYLGYPLCFLSPSLHPLPPFCFILLSHLLFLWTEKISPPAPGRLCRGPSRYWLARPQETFACKPPSPHRYLLPSPPLLLFSFSLVLILFCLSSSHPLFLMYDVVQPRVLVHSAFSIQQTEHFYQVWNKLWVYTFLFFFFFMFLLLIFEDITIDSQPDGISSHINIPKIMK